MSKTGPIIIIDDDQDDQEMIDRILVRLPLKNEIKKFFDGEKALRYFRKTTDNPLLVLCDINMPLMNGMELKKTIQQNDSLNKKTMPFVFLTTTANPAHVNQAYNLCCQGFFVKGHTFTELKDTIVRVVNYWSHAEHPC